MSRRWADFLQDSAPAAHGVQIYGDAGEFAETVAAFLAAGFERGEPAVVVATREHGTRFFDVLAQQGWEASRIARDELLQFKEADEVLAAITIAGRPSAPHFERVVGRLLDRAEARHPERRVRVLGEMVDVLCKRGETEAAAELEELWNGLARTRDFSLLCGYELDLFDRQAQLETLPSVCASHSHVRSAGDEARLAQAVDRALEDVLGADEAGKVYLLLGTELRQARVPTPQLVLMWVSANMPVLADRILSVARDHSADAAPAPATA